MEEITVYQPLYTKGEDGKWYKVWQIPVGFPLPAGEIVTEGPPESMAHPKYDFSLGQWVEDDLSVMDDMQDKVAKASQIFAILVPKTEVSDSEALEMEEFYPEWSPDGVAYAGDKSIVQHEGLWRCIKSHTSQPTWAPSIDTASLWERIELEHTGTLEDPIPAQIPMEYFAGKIYSEDGQLYNCTRDSGQAMSHLPSALVGQYFEAL